MANLYENIPEMQARAAANEQRRKIAESLLVQSQDQVQPFVNTGRMVAPMSITQGLAQMLKAYYAGKGIRSANEGDKALASEHAAKAAEAIAAYKAQSQGVPERAPAPVMPVSGVGPPKTASGPPVPGVAPDPRGALISALGNQYLPPETKQALTYGDTTRREDLRLDEDRTLRRDNALLAAETRLYDIQQRMQDRQLTREQQAQLAQEANATRMAIAEMGRNLQQQPAPAYAEIIDPKDPSRMLKIDGRLYKGGSLGDPGVVGIAGKEPASAKAAETRGTGGNAVIDEQHRALFADANRILSAMLAERPVNELADLIDHLMADVVRHFKDEEAIIATAGFKGTVEHRAIHHQLLDRALTLVGRFHAGILGVGELFQFLGYDLVAQHMLSADREFFATLRNNGREFDSMT